MQPRWIAHASIAIPVSEQFRDRAAMYINPLIRIDFQGALRQTYVGCIFQFKTAYLGVIYQNARNPINLSNTNTLSIGPGVELPLSGQTTVTLGYSFDMPLSGLGPRATSGSHELSARFSFGNTCMFGTGRNRGFFGQGRRHHSKTKCYEFLGKSFLGFLN